MSLSDAYHQLYGSWPVVHVRAPGRVNLLGEHVDYNDGPVLPVAIDRSVYIAAAPTGSDLLRLTALDLNEEVVLNRAGIETGCDLTGAPVPGWARYPVGVAWALQKSGLELVGVQALYSSDLPIGAGLSSSAAVEVGFAVLWQALGGWSRSPLVLAQICQRAENEYVGVNSGLMDQFSSACGVAGHALYFDTRSLEWSAVPLPEDVVIVIADSSVRRSLSGSAYNDRRAACEQAVTLLREYVPGLTSLRDISTPEFAAYSAFLPDEIRRRAEHVVKEIGRVNSAVSALHRRDLSAFGALMYAGHSSLRDLYEVSIPELDGLVEIARRQPGCFGARLTGAGFGGCTVNIVQKEAVRTFAAGLLAEYSQRFNRQASVYQCVPSAGAHIENK